MQYNSKITLCDDGKYRWIYEINLFKNPMFYFLVLKIFLAIFLVGLVLSSVFDYLNWGAQKVVENLPFFGYCLLGIIAITGLGYIIYAAIMGGKYIVEFEMDQNGFVHRQTAAQAKKAKKIGKTAMLGGAAAGNLGAISTGIAAQRTEMYTDFAKVKKVRALPRRNLIKVSEGLEHNQIYAQREDFDFVLNFILSHCANIQK